MLSHVQLERTQSLPLAATVEALKVLVLQPVGRLEMPFVVGKVSIGVVTDQAVRGGLVLSCD